jgi:polyisoprenyl-phosphate glycosyltransferase
MSVTHSPEVFAIVVPFYNEEQVVAAFHQLLCQAIDPLEYLFKLVYVNDGSTDGTARVLAEIARQDARVKVIELSRNFGHQAALTAGMDAALADSALADAVICIDGDGQQPPQLIPEMIDLYHHGYDLVLAQRSDDGQPSRFKQWTSSMFYRLINLLSDTHIEPGVADFRLMSGQVVQALQQMPEYHRFLRGMVSWVGFRTVIIPYQPPQRLAGESKYSLRKMLDLAFDAIFSFSLTPLKIALGIGGAFFFLAMLEVLYVLSFWVRGLEHTLARGWSSLMFVILIVSGMIMINLGFIGVYIGYIFQEVKRRPIYIAQAERRQRAKAEPEATLEEDQHEQ